MKTKVLLAIAFLAIISTIGMSQSYILTEAEVRAEEKRRNAKEAEEKRIKKLEPNIASLYGVKGIHVFVLDLHDNAKAAGLTKEQLKSDVELKLRLAGIKVNTEEECQASNGRPYLHVGVNSVNDEHLFSFYADLQFRQAVRLQRDPDLLIQFAPTWNTGGIGSVGKSKFKEFIRDSVKDQVDRFINDYLTANPKK